MPRRNCPFPDCDWSVHFDDDYEGRLGADFKSESHYEREHAGRVRVKVALMCEQQLGERTPQEVADEYHERWQDEYGDQLAFVRAEEIEPADDHSKIEKTEITQGTEEN